MNAPKIASLAAGVAVIAIAAFATQLDTTMRIGLLALGCFLCGYVVPPPGSGKAVGVAAALLFALGSGSALTGCSGARLPTTDQVTSARGKTELVVALAGQALPIVQAEVDRLVAAGFLNQSEADQARAGLAKADTVLAVSEAWLAGRADAPGREQVLEGIDGAALAAAIVRRAGGKLHPLTDRAIGLARELVEGKR